MKSISVFVVSHKKYKMPEDKMYIPLQVGAEGKEKINGYIQDNDKIDNISKKNPYFCELTGLYYIWKNISTDYVGLVHYRRYFTTKRNIPKREEEKFKIVLSKNEAEKILEENDVILPKKRKYYIENLYDHYQHTMYVEPLDETAKIIQEKYPEYMNEFNKLHTRTSAHMFKWLFDILFELENRMKEQEKEYDKFHSRFYGRISELLLDVWINKNNIKYSEVKVIDMQKINWWKKGISFLKAKYEKSF